MDNNLWVMCREVNRYIEKKMRAPGGARIISGC